MFKKNLIDGKLSIEKILSLIEWVFFPLEGEKDRHCSILIAEHLLEH